MYVTANGKCRSSISRQKNPAPSATWGDATSKGPPEPGRSSQLTKVIAARETSANSKRASQQLLRKQSAIDTRLDTFIGDSDTANAIIKLFWALPMNFSAPIPLLPGISSARSSTARPNDSMRYLVHCAKAFDVMVTSGI